MAESPDQQELNIKDEYELWRKNCKYMYEFINETALTWPSLTVQWLPTLDTANEAINARLLLGTHTSGEGQNHLKVASTQLPVKGSGKKVSSKIKITQKLECSSEVNRARYKPQNPDIVATINGSGELDFYNLKTNEKFGHVAPHSQNGYGLSWSLYKDNYLLSSSDDHTVVLTNAGELDKNNGRIHKFTAHSDIVNDVKWHSFDENLFGSVSDDKHLLLFDIRSPGNPAITFVNNESKGINSLSFSPFSRNLIALGNTNSNINLLDLRKLSKSSTPLHTMMGHGDAITCLEFSPHKDGIVASGSQDRRVILWDLTKIGEEQTQEDAEDGCPEIFMMHAGHTGGVTDLSWCPFDDWTLASVADDNIVHLWEVSQSLVKETPVNPQDSELE